MVWLSADSLGKEGSKSCKPQPVAHPARLGSVSAHPHAHVLAVPPAAAPTPLAPTQGLQLGWGVCRRLNSSAAERADDGLLFTFDRLSLGGLLPTPGTASGVPTVHANLCAKRRLWLAWILKRACIRVCLCPACTCTHTHTDSHKHTLAHTHSCTHTCTHAQSWTYTLIQLCFLL